MVKSLICNKIGEHWVSGVFTPDKSNVTVGVLFAEASGGVFVEMSIDGENWVVAGQVVSSANISSRYVLKGLSGFVKGMCFRVVCSTEPESVKYLE
jgi:hypothetical protein